MPSCAQRPAASRRPEADPGDHLPSSRRSHGTGLPELAGVVFLPEGFGQEHEWHQEHAYRPSSQSVTDRCRATRASRTPHEGRPAGQAPARFPAVSDRQGPSGIEGSRQPSLVQEVAGSKAILAGRHANGGRLAEAHSRMGQTAAGTVRACLEAMQRATSAVRTPRAGCCGQNSSVVDPCARRCGSPRLRSRIPRRAESWSAPCGPQ